MLITVIPKHLLKNIETTEIPLRVATITNENIEIEVFLFKKGNVIKVGFNAPTSYKIDLKKDFKINGGEK